MVRCPLPVSFWIRTGSTCFWSGVLPPSPSDWCCTRSVHYCFGGTPPPTLVGLMQGEVDACWYHLSPSLWSLSPHVHSCSLGASWFLDPPSTLPMPVWRTPSCLSLAPTVPEVSAACMLAYSSLFPHLIFLRSPLSSCLYVGVAMPPALVCWLP